MRTEQEFQPLAYRVNDALRVAGIGRTKLYELIRDGALPVRKIGKRTLIPADALRALVGLEEAA
jgi:excisionase family DNA binding protein